MKTDIVRFKVNPPNVAAPVGFRDLYVSADGVLTLEHPDGTKTTFVRTGTITTGDVIGYGTFTGRVTHSLSTYTGASTTDDVGLHVCNSATGFTLTVTDGSNEGESIKLTNKGAGTVTLSGNISTVTATDTLLTGETITLVWDGSEWI